MYIIHDYNSQSGTLLYTVNHHIYVRSRSGELFTRPLLLSNDYASCLTGIPYEDTVYYAYLSESGGIVLKTVNDLRTLYTLTPVQSHTLSAPTLLTLSGHLLLFYINMDTDSTAYRIDCLLPFQSDRSLNTLLLPDYPTVPAYTVTDCISQGVLIVRCGTNTAYYKITQELKLEILISKKDTEPLQKKLDAQTEQIRNLEQKITTQTAIIQSASNQYKELMDIATAYKNEALKWHNKYHKN